MGAKDGSASREQIVTLLGARTDAVSLVLCAAGAAAPQKGGGLVLPSLLPDERPSWLWTLVASGALLPLGVVGASTAISIGPGTGVSDETEVRRVFSRPIVRFGAVCSLLCELAVSTRPLRMWRHVLLSELSFGTRLMVEIQVSHTGAGTFDVRARGPEWAAAHELVRKALEKTILEDENDSLLELLAVSCRGCGGDTHLVSRVEVAQCCAARRAHFVCPSGFCLRLETLLPDQNLSNLYPVVEPVHSEEDGRLSLPETSQIVEVTKYVFFSGLRTQFFQ